MKRYRVVETRWVGSERVEKDIGCQWKTERLAKAELKELQLKSTVRQYSIQKEK